MPSEEWPVSAALVENAQDNGFVHLELRIGLHADVVTEGRFGLGIAVDSRPGAEYRLPGIEGFPLLDADIYLLGKYTLGSVPSDETGAWTCGH